ncbi:MAG: hypothetical protein IKJ58_02190 [Akkermansia sp.]|nr:hypothetical protein [Akkermansia sp.]
MKEIYVEIGKTYALRSQGGGAVQDAEGNVLKHLVAAQQEHMTAQEPVWFVPEDCRVTKVFNAALALLGQPSGGGSSELLPGYTRLEYLENTGTQYLVLPVKFKDTSGFAVSYKVKRHSSYDYLSVIRYSGKTLEVGRIATDEKTGVTTTSPTTFTLVANNGKIFAAWNEYESNKIKVATQGEETETDIPHRPAVGESVTPVYLMAWDSGLNLGVYNPSAAHYSLYEARFTLGKQLVHQYVPALDPTGAPCMFDLVSKQAYPNNGSGQFTAGVADVGVLANILLALPHKEAAGSKLHVRLPDGANMAEAERIAALAGDLKNWQITFAL